jgi:hypothetical protein
LLSLASTLACQELMPKVCKASIKITKNCLNEL